jgi:hypothetical protein
MIGRFECHNSGFGQAEIFGIGAHVQASVGKNLVARLEFSDLFADRFNFSGQLTPQDIDFGFIPSKRHARGQPEGHGHVELAGGEIGKIPRRQVAVIDRRRMDPDQDFVVFGGRFRHIFELENIGGAIFREDNCFH